MKIGISKILFPLSRLSFGKSRRRVQICLFESVDLVQQPAPLADSGYVALPADWKIGITYASSVLDSRMGPSRAPVFGIRTIPIRNPISKLAVGPILSSNGLIEVGNSTQQTAIPNITFAELSKDNEKFRCSFPNSHESGYCIAGWASAFGWEEEEGTKSGVLEIRLISVPPDT